MGLSWIISANDTERGGRGRGEVIMRKYCVVGREGTVKKLTETALVNEKTCEWGPHIRERGRILSTHTRHPSLLASLIFNNKKRGSLFEKQSKKKALNDLLFRALEGERKRKILACVCYTRVYCGQMFEYTLEGNKKHLYCFQ